MKNKTAVNWLEAEFLKLEQLIGVHGCMYELIEKAKELEKKQHGNTWDAAIQAHEDRGGVIARSITDFDEYYNLIYGGNQ